MKLKSERETTFDLAMFFFVVMILIFSGFVYSGCKTAPLKPANQNPNGEIIGGESRKNEVEYTDENADIDTIGGPDSNGVWRH